MLARADMQRHDTRVSISVCRLLGLASLTSTAAVDQKRIFLAQSQDIERSSLDPGFLHEIVNTFFVGLLSATQAMKAYISTVRVHVHVHVLLLGSCRKTACLITQRIASKPEFKQAKRQL